MTFFLRTGYGVSKAGYGGSTDDPTFGLGQGNGMAPSGFTSVSALMVGALRRLGHASTFSGAWTGLLFTLAAIIYVDDTDLLLRSRSRDTTLDEFFCECQSAVTDWGRIVLATGGYLKAAKCFWYMMA
jgi:acetylornithine/succinyldiaminopimelate/putrescine aminotransferase